MNQRKILESFSKSISKENRTEKKIKILIIGSYQEVLELLHRLNIIYLPTTQRESEKIASYKERIQNHKMKLEALFVAGDNQQLSLAINGTVNYEFIFLNPKQFLSTNEQIKLYQLFLSNTNLTIFCRSAKNIKEFLANDLKNKLSIDISKYDHRARFSSKLKIDIGNMLTQESFNETPKKFISILAICSPKEIESFIKLLQIPEYKTCALKESDEGIKEFLIQDDAQSYYKFIGCNNYVNIKNLAQKYKIQVIHVFDTEFIFKNVEIKSQIDELAIKTPVIFINPFNPEDLNINDYFDMIKTLSKTIKVQFEKTAKVKLFDSRDNIMGNSTLNKEVINLMLDEEEEKIIFEPRGDRCLSIKKRQAQHTVEQHLKKENKELKEEKVEPDNFFLFRFN